MKHDDLTCKKLILDCLLDFEDGSMPACMNFLATYRATGKTLRMLKPTDIPPALAQTVMAFVRARREKEKG
jgi:hypothetical protein